MTVIYTDPRTGKKYDRQLLSVITGPRQGSGCEGCAFNQDHDCLVEPCMVKHYDKQGNILKCVYFVFKERTA